MVASAHPFCSSKKENVTKLWICYNSYSIKWYWIELLWWVTSNLIFKLCHFSCIIILSFVPHKKKKKEKKKRKTSYKKYYYLLSFYSETIYFMKCQICPHKMCIFQNHHDFLRITAHCNLLSENWESEEIHGNRGNLQTSSVRSKNIKS